MPRPIVSYALSSILTGTVFYLMGRFQFGYIVGFIPRHILIGCIGGVGWFLVATGFEVSARIEGSLEYDLATLNKLLQPDTVPLWMTPLALAIVLFWSQQRTANRYFLPVYIMAIPLVFYFFVLALDALDADTLRDHGWIFEGPPADEPWWYFYTLYRTSCGICNPPALLWPAGANAALQSSTRSTGTRSPSASPPCWH